LAVQISYAPHVARFPRTRSPLARQQNPLASALCALLVYWRFLVFRAVDCPIVIHDSAYGISSRTGNIIANASYIDNQPFDGITINIPATWGLLAPGSVWTYNDIYPSWLEPLKGVLKRVTHNYCKIVTRPQADPFDDYSQCVANWVALAQACRDAGLEGIWFDNEEYYEKMWDYPQSCKYGSTKTLSQYQEQYRLRGTEVMQAILAQWPTCKIVHTHGPYESDSRTPQQVDAGSFSGGADNHLAGYFFCGMFAAAPGQVIDGGEVYLYRQQSDYSFSYDWRKNQMPDLVPNTLIQTAIKNVWFSSASISFANYDETYQGVTMDPSIWQSCITWGLQRCDYMVWTYSETQNFLAPGGAGADWIVAIWNARHAAGIPDPKTSSSEAAPQTNEM
jgi:hypothetical protein